MIDVQTFLDSFDEFSNTNELKIQMYLNLMVENVSVDQFGNNYETAVFLLTAHALSTVGGNTSSQGQLSSEKVGDITYQYNIITGEEYLSQSNYGLMYLELRKCNVISAIVL